MARGRGAGAVSGSVPALAGIGLPFRNEGRPAARAWTIAADGGRVAAVGRLSRRPRLSALPSPPRPAR